MSTTDGSRKIKIDRLQSSTTSPLRLIRHRPSLADLIAASTSTTANSSESSITCPTCSKSFRNQGALRLHRVKTHGEISTTADNRLLHGSKSRRSTIDAYFCPVIDCKYNWDEDEIDRSTTNWFGTLSALKQHYGKVHDRRRFVCKICEKAKFGLEKSLRYHEKMCGERRRRTLRANRSIDQDGVDEAIDLDVDDGILDDHQNGDDIIDKSTDQSNRGRSIVPSIHDLNDDGSRTDREDSTIPDRRPENVSDRSTDPRRSTIDGANSTSVPPIGRVLLIIRPPITSTIRRQPPRIDRRPPDSSINRVHRSAAAISTTITSKSIKQPKRPIPMHPRRILPKPTPKSTSSTQTDAIDTIDRRSISIATQCDQSEFLASTGWPLTSNDHHQIFVDSSTMPDYDQLSYLTGSNHRYSTYDDSDRSGLIYRSTQPINQQQNEVAYNDFFCQTYMTPHMADASVATDFRPVSMVTSGQQCQLLTTADQLYAPPLDHRSQDLLTPPSFVDDEHHQGTSTATGDQNLAGWTSNIETQTDIAMMEFDDLFSYTPGEWQDMETQT